MKEEVSVAVRFLVKVIENGNGTLSQEQLEGFQVKLVELLCSRFEKHWFPEKPVKGQAYRCLRFNETDRKDSAIEKAAAQAGLTYDQLKLPTELTIWVDPKEVCCRFGESQGSFCTLANFKNGGNGDDILDVNFDEIRKKSQELRDKQNQDMCTRKNGRRGFLAVGVGGNRVGGTVVASPNFKGGRSFGQIGQGVYTSHQHVANHHPHSQHPHNPHHPHHPTHHVHHPGNIMGHHNHTPSPAAVSWYNSVNGSNSNVGVSEMFSSSPPNHFYGLAKFSPPKYGYGSPSKWSSPPHHSSYGGPPLPSAKGDKYHWFNSNKTTIKA